METESAGVGKSASDNNDQSQERKKSKMEFGNEMQETFQLALGDLGSARKSGGSLERNNIV